MRTPSEEHDTAPPTSIGVAFVTEVGSAVAVNDVDNLSGELIPSFLRVGRGLMGPHR